MTRAAANLNLWRPPTADEVLSWTDGELYVYGQRGGGDPSISVSYLIWRLDHNGMHTPTTAATDRFPTATDARMAMKNRLANYKRRARMTHKDHPAVHNDAGACPGWFWKTLLYDPNVIDHQGNPHEQGKAFIRIALAPRLGQALMSLTRRKKKRSGAGPELYGQKGLISRLDRLNVLKLVALVRYLETGRGPCPPIMEEMEACSANDLWEIISWLGLNTARETWRARSAPEDAAPGFSTADAFEKAQGIKDRTQKLAMAAVQTAKGNASRSAIAAKGAVTKLIPSARISKALAIALIFGLVVSVGATAVVYSIEPETIIHQWRTEGPVGVAKYTKIHFLDKKMDHQLRYNAAFAFWKSGDRDRATRILEGILSEDPNDYTLASCKYILGLLAMERNQLHLALDQLIQAERHTKHPEFKELIEIEQARAWSFMKVYSKAKEILKPLTGVSKINYSVLLEVRGRVEQEDGRLSVALDLAKERLKVIRDLGHSSRTGYALQHIGFLHASLGDLTLANNATLQAEAKALKAGDQKLLHFTMVNRVAITKCSGLDYSDLEETIRQYATSADLPDLRTFLAEALKMTCQPGT